MTSQPAPEELPESSCTDPDCEEDHGATNPHANMPTGQGSNIPLGWKPTAAEPVPVVRCTQILKSGDRCKRWSLRGYHKCFTHSGKGGLKNVEQYRESVIEAARLRILDLGDSAVDTIEGLMQPGTGEAIRLKAATEILDRAGIRGGFEVKVEADISENPADELAKRLSKLADGATAVQKLRDRSAAAANPDEDIIDAEIVEDPEQPTLFDLDDTETP